MKRNISYPMLDPDEFPRKVAKMSLFIFLFYQLFKQLGAFYLKNFLEHFN
jgi:hypothetical protein